VPKLEALATATPDHRLDQADAERAARQVVEEARPELADLVDVFDRAGVASRSIARPLPFYLDEPGWPERAEAFEEAGVDLAEDATRSTLEAADLSAQALDAVVFVTTTGLATPSLETHLANRLDLPADVRRVPVWGLGCAGGVAGLARGTDLARARSGDRVLVVSLELCSLAFLRDELDEKTVVASALFGDGAAAALVAGDELAAGGPELGASRSHLWPDTRDVMGWEVAARGLEVVMSQRIPEIVEQRLPGVVEPFVKQAADGRQARPVLHPGGPKVLDAYAGGLGVDEAHLAPSREVLREHGNMSSPTVLFALERVLDEGLAPGSTAWLGAVGPGFAAELMALEAPA